MHFKVKRTTKFSKVRLVRVAPSSACLGLLSQCLASSQRLLCGAVRPQIMGAYCAKKSIATDQVRFLFDGTRLNGEQTPEDVRAQAPFPPALHPRPAALQPASLVRRQYYVATGDSMGDAVRLPLCACARVSL